MATIQGVYVALFGRPADPTGLSFFNAATSNGANLNAIGNLASTAEYQARFTGLNNIQIINSIYQSLFGRDADLTGLTFFSNALANGSLNINNIAIAILDGAQGTDRTISNNKIAAADLYTKALDTGAEVVAYSGLAAAAQGRAFVTAVSSTVPTTAQVDTSVAAMVTASTGGGTGTVGVTLSLTSGVDFLSADQTNAAFKSTTGNDTIRAATVGDLATTDSIDGGAGTDTLNAAMAVAATAPATSVSVAPIIKNVENINLTYGTLTAPVTFAAADVNGAQKIVADALTTSGATNTFSFTGVEKTAIVEFKNVTSSNTAGTAETAEVSVGFRDVAGSNDSATISLNKVTLQAAGTANEDTLKVTVAGVENLTINSTGFDANAANYNKVTVADAAAVKFVITGDRDITLTNDGTNTALKTVDASALTGKLTYTATTNGETIFGGTKGDAITLSGGTLADTLVYTSANASTLNNLDSITGFQAGTNVTAVDKIDVKAFALGADTTIGATNLSPTGDTAGFFSGTNRIVFNDTSKVLYVDVNKDGAFNASTDLAVTLTGVSATNLDKGDFILA